MQAPEGDEVAVGLGGGFSGWEMGVGDKGGGKYEESAEEGADFVSGGGAAHVHEDDCRGAFGGGGGLGDGWGGEGGEGSVVLLMLEESIVSSREFYSGGR